MSLNAYSSIFSLFTHCAELISAFGLISPFTSPQYTFARSMSPLCGVIPTKSLKYLMFDTSTKGNSSFISLCRQSISDSPSMGFPPGKIQVSFFFTRRISLSLIANTFIAILSMSQWPESNRRPTRYECVALPTELHWRITPLSKFSMLLSVRYSQAPCRAQCSRRLREKRMRNRHSAALHILRPLADH